MENKKIAVIGLGYVGLTFAITLAKVGFKVLGIENNDKIFKSMIKGKAQFYEENIDQFLIKMQKNKALFQMPLFSLFVFILFTIYLFTNFLFTIILFTYLAFIFLGYILIYQYNLDLNI